MLTEKQIKRIIEGVYEGEFVATNLPKELFMFTFTEIIGTVEDGFGPLINEAKINRMLDYRKNIFAFSGAKTFNEVKDLSFLMFDEFGKKRPFNKFRDDALKINNQYNVNWLKTEQDTAFGMSQGAEKWMNYEDEAELFPYLQYQTADDERVRDEHTAWDNIIRKVDDDFWNTRMPPNGYNCRCTVIQLPEGKQTNLRGKPQNDEPLFSNNPGKVKFIFDPKVHPYFKVEKRFKTALKENFGFKMPES